MKFNRLTKAAIVTGAAIMLFGTAVSAGTTMQDYSTTVGRFNGSGYTSYQTKSSGNDKGLLYSNAVGGSYTVDARMESKKADIGRRERYVTSCKISVRDHNHTSLAYSHTRRQVEIFARLFPCPALAYDAKFVCSHHMKPFQMRHNTNQLSRQIAYGYFRCADI